MLIGHGGGSVFRGVAQVFVFIFSRNVISCCYHMARFSDLCPGRLFWIFRAQRHCKRFCTDDVAFGRRYVMSLPCQTLHFCTDDGALLPW